MCQGRLVPRSRAAVSCQGYRWTYVSIVSVVSDPLIGSFTEMFYSRPCRCLLLLREEGCRLSYRVGRAFEPLPYHSQAMFASEKSLNPLF
ncbi:hypothetical protein VTK26DRAFT_5799 [Humicola hyalothermophila]